MAGFRDAKGIDRRAAEADVARILGPESLHAAAATRNHRLPIPSALLTS